MISFLATIRRVLLAAVIALMPLVAVAQDWDRGLAAAQAGDYETALKEWLPMAENGNAIAQTNIGVMYENGHGVPQDYKEAARWYRLAAEQGDAEAQTALGNMYYRGAGMSQSYGEAFRLFRLAAEQGLPVAQQYVGFMYMHGYGAGRNWVAAYMWSEIASANGNKTSGINRDWLAKMMTEDAAAEAERRAKVCMESSYKECN